jgi:hypothetical protein
LADLITLNAWQDERGLPHASNTQESQIISQCSARIEEFLGRTIGGGVQAYTEILSGNNSAEICLRNRPLTITGLAVYEDDGAYFGQATGAFDVVKTLLVLGTDYALKVDQPDGVTSRCGILLKMSGWWRRPWQYQGGVINPTQQIGSGNYKVVYSAGYATVPLDIQQACMFLCAVVKSRALLGEAYQSESKENYAYTLRPLVKAAFAGLPADTLGILARYRNVGVA